MKTKLSVNINKIATLRNARGGNTPNVVEAAINCENLVHRELLCTQDPTSDTLPTKMYLI